MNTLKSILSKYLGHLVGYIVAAAGVVSVVDPKGLPPIAVLGVSVAGLITTAAHHGYAAGTGTTAAQAAVDAAAKILTTVAKPAALGLVLVLAALAGTAGLTACSTLPAVTSAQAQPYVIAVAQVAVDVAEAHGITAAQINSVAKQALAADSGAVASLSALSALVNVQLAKAKLPQADIDAVEVVEVAVTTAFATQLGANPTVAQTQAAVADFLNALIAATTPVTTTSDQILTRGWNLVSVNR